MKIRKDHKVDQIERLITALTDSLVQKSEDGGTQKLTILDNVAVGTNQACRSCLLHLPATNSGKIHVTTANEAADANDFLLPTGQVIPFPVNNVSDLRFYGTVNGDVIHILWRN
jgi:hypothetical protein